MWKCISILVICYIALRILPQTPAGQNKALDELQGVWIPSKITSDSQVLSQALLDVITLVVKENKFHYVCDNDCRSANIQFPDNSQPTWFDFHVEGIHGNQLLSGLIKRDADSLTIAINLDERPTRPVDFAAKQERVEVATFKRANVTIDELPGPRVGVGRAIKYERARRSMKTLSLAINAYEDKYAEYPPVALCDKDGKPLLSWRVAILPFIKKEDLFRKFKLDEAWNSVNNLKLLKEMPRVYGLNQETDQGFQTPFQVFVGDEAPFRLGRHLTQRDIFRVNGVQKTILLAESKKSVPWTQPSDLEYGVNANLPQLGAVDAIDGFHIALFDATVLFVPQIHNTSILRCGISWRTPKNFGNRSLAADRAQLTTAAFSIVTSWRFPAAKDVASAMLASPSWNDAWPNWRPA